MPIPITPPLATHIAKSPYKKQLQMGEKEKKKIKKQKHQHPNHDQTTTTTSDYSFKPSCDVKGIRFGCQFIVKSFTIRQARPLQLLHLLSLVEKSIAFRSTCAFLPTNFTILAHHAWHTLTLGLGTKKSKVLIFVFESENLKNDVDRIWPQEIPLGEVNRKLIRGLTGCELARFKFRKGCLTFYVYAVRRVGNKVFSCADELRFILEHVVALNDFLDHTFMLAMPNQRTINYAAPTAMAH